MRASLRTPPGPKRLYRPDADTDTRREYLECGAQVPLDILLDEPRTRILRREVLLLTTQVVVKSSIVQPTGMEDARVIVSHGRVPNDSVNEPLDANQGV